MCSKDIPRCNCRDLYHFDSCCMYRAGAWIFTLFFIFFPVGENRGKAATTNLITGSFVLPVSLRCIFQHTLKNPSGRPCGAQGAGSDFPTLLRTCHRGEFSCPTTHPEQPSSQNRAECLQK